VQGLDYRPGSASPVTQSASAIGDCKYQVRFAQFNYSSAILIHATTFGPVR